MKITYGQILKEFQNFATNHKQINEFANGDLWEAIQHNKLSNFQYPLMFVVDTPVSVGVSEITSNFDILVMDKASEDIENDVKSDTLLILLDIVAYFDKKTTDNWKFVELVKGGSISPFTEKFDDTLTGWKINIGLKQPIQYDECAIPNK